MAILSTTCFGGFLWHSKNKKEKCITMPMTSGTGTSVSLQSGSEVAAPPKHVKETSKRTPSSYCCSTSSALYDLTVCSDCSAGQFNANDFLLLIQTRYDVLQELSDAAAETETSLLVSGLVINCHVCLFVMTQSGNLSALSHSSLS